MSLIITIGAGCTSAPAPVADDITVEAPTQINAPIQFTSPDSGAFVSTQFTVTGQARVYENTLLWRIFDANEQLIDDGFIMVDSPDIGEFGPFSLDLDVAEVTTGSFVVELFTYSAEDGSIDFMVDREFLLQDQRKTTVNVFFLDVDAGELACDEVDFERRTTAYTSAPATYAMQELLAGPESEWARTEIPAGTTLESVVIDDGLATVRLLADNMNAWSGGSCHVLAIRAQIEQTLLQFETVDRVAIYINGETDVLEP